jgi:hypothetical protein
LEPDSDGNLVQYIGDWTAGTTYYLTRSNFPYQYKQEIDQPLIKPFLASALSFVATSVDTAIAALNPVWSMYAQGSTNDRYRDDNYDPIGSTSPQRAGYYFSFEEGITMCQGMVFRDGLSNKEYSVNGDAYPGSFKIYPAEPLVLTAANEYSVYWVFRVDGTAITSFISFGERDGGTEFFLSDNSLSFNGNSFTLSANFSNGRMRYNAFSMSSGGNLKSYSTENLSGRATIFDTTIVSGNNLTIEQIENGVQGSDRVIKLCCVLVFDKVLSDVELDAIYSTLQPIYGDL